MAVGVLLIHGFMGSPREFNEVEQLLQQAGYLTYAVTLPGHGHQPDYALAHADAEKILNHCWEEYQRFAEQCQQVFIVGHSLGGVCALITASKKPPKLAGITAFSAPFEHAFFVNRIWGLFGLKIPTLLKGLVYMPQCRTGFERPEYHPLLFPKLYREASCLLQQVKQAVEYIEVPVNLVHSKYDLVVPYTEMEKIAKQIGKEHLITTHTLENSGHQIFPKSKDLDQSLSLLQEFLQTHQIEFMEEALETPF